jgi:hypothetical protein
MTKKVLNPSFLFPPLKKGEKKGDLGGKNDKKRET